MPQQALTMLIYIQCPLFHISYVSKKMTKISTFCCCPDQQIIWASLYCFLILVPKWEIWVPYFGVHTCILTSKIELSLIGENCVSHGACTGLSDQALVFAYDMKLEHVVYTIHLKRKIHLTGKSI